MEKNYRFIRLNRDYYNNITPQEIESIYAFGKHMVSVDVGDYIFNAVLVLLTIVITIFCLVQIFVSHGAAAIFNQTIFEGVYVVIVLIAAVVEAIILTVSEIKKWSYFYFGKGKIISLESEYHEPDKKHPDGYYRHALAIALTETEAVDRIYYFDRKPWKKEDYIGEYAIAVYFQNAHLLYAVVDGEDAAEYTREFKEEMFDKKRRKK